MITKSHRQEGLSRAYIQAVAAKAGFGCNPRSVDYGMDLSLNHIKSKKGRLCESGFALDVQARSSTTSNLRQSALVYDLDVYTYEMLRHPLSNPMRILVVLVLPSSESEWLQISEQELLLRGAAYWYNLRGHPDSKNRKSVRVEIPRSQLFTPEALHELANPERGGWQS